MENIVNFFFDNAKKFATDAIKTPPERVIQDKAEATSDLVTAEATGDLVEYKITNKVTNNSPQNNPEMFSQTTKINRNTKRKIYIQKKGSKLLMS